MKEVVELVNYGGGRAWGGLEFTEAGGEVLDYETRFSEGDVFLWDGDYRGAAEGVDLRWVSSKRRSCEGKGGKRTAFNSGGASLVSRR